jgi:3-phosphoshikimate 1-carboxyvinyltransferase
VPTLIDEIPILAVTAAFVSGVSVFEGVSELKVKESDRLSKIIELLSLAGIKTKKEGDNLIVEGGGAVKSFEFDAASDHRMFMSAAILALLGGVSAEILGASSIKVSYPTFLDDLRGLYRAL